MQSRTRFTWCAAVLTCSVLASLIAACGSGGSEDAGGPAAPQRSATLAWDPPSANADGSVPVDDLAGYVIYYGTTSGSYSNLLVVGPAVTGATVEPLPSGRVYFVVRAYDTSGNHSAPSEEVFKDVP